MSTDTPPTVATPAALAELLALAERGDFPRLRALLAEMHPSDIADLVASVPSEEQRLEILKILPDEIASGTLAEMEEDEDRAELFTALDSARGVALLQELADDARVLTIAMLGARTLAVTFTSTADAVEPKL